VFAPISTHSAVDGRPSSSARRPRSPAHRAGFGVLVACVVACGPSYPESEYPTAPPAGVSASADDFAPAPPGALWRRDVDEVVDAGLGKFLQRAELRAQLHEGTFVGFRVLELRPPAWWQGVDLVPGDVITQVNGMPIEQPTEAHAAFESLRKSDKLVVSYLRDGAARELSYSIIQKPIKPTVAK
jgi:S1-C subfamily serine protease